MPVSERSGIALVVFLALAAPAAAAEPVPLDLQVKAGTPLQIQIDSKTPVRKGEPVRGTLVHAVHVFDREVLPAGTVVLGGVTQVKSAPRSERLQNYLSGRVRTRKEALVSFDEILLNDGRRMPFSTSVTSGTPALMRVTSGPPPGKPGKILTAKDRMVRAAREAGTGAVNGLKHEFLSYWPFGTQYVQRGARFTAVVQQGLDFGTISVASAQLERVGSAPDPGTVLHARLLDKVTSATAHPGSPVRAITTRPVFSSEGFMIVPEGTEILGEVTRSTPAGRFGRNGRLQIRFTKIDALSGPALSGPGRAVSGTLEAVEVDHRLAMKLDAEGAARIPVSKKRFIAPALALYLSTNAVPGADDTIKAQGGAPGWSGFGLVGAAASMATYKVAGPLGWWGSASSIYTSLIRKAAELEFPANTVLEIRVGRSPGGDAMRTAELPAAALAPEPKLLPVQAFRRR